MTSRKRKLVEEEILRVAAVCFSERGYPATTLEDIATKVGISRVTFYAYFKNKEELLKTIFDRMLTTYQKGLETILATPLSRPEKLRRAVAHQVACLTNDPASVRVFFNEEKNLPSALARQVQEAQKKIETTLEQEIAAGITRGEIVTMNPRLIMYAFVGMCNWLYRWYTPGEAVTPEEIVDTFTQILNSGSVVQPRAPKEAPAADRLSKLEADVEEIKRQLQKVPRSLRPSASR